jgi:hypothetical protein
MAIEAGMTMVSLEMRVLLLLQQEGRLLLWETRLREMGNRGRVVILRSLKLGHVKGVGRSKV